MTQISEFGAADFILHKTPRLQCRHHRAAPLPLVYIILDLKSAICCASLGKYPLWKESTLLSRQCSKKPGPVAGSAPLYHACCASAPPGRGKAARRFALGFRGVLRKYAACSTCMCDLRADGIRHYSRQRHNCHNRTSGTAWTHRRP